MELSQPRECQVVSSICLDRLTEDGELGGVRKRMSTRYRFAAGPSEAESAPVAEMTLAARRIRAHETDPVLRPLTGCDMTSSLGRLLYRVLRPGRQLNA
jgi:hypothetical protein